MKIIKGFPATSNNNYQLNMTTIIKHASRNYGKQEIVSRKYDGTLFRYTYLDAFIRMQRLANALITLGVKPGDRVGALAWNTHQYYEIFFGVPGTGAVLLLLNLRLGSLDLSYVVNHSEAKYLIVEENLINVAESIAPEIKNVKGYIIITDKKLSDINTDLSPVYSYETLLTKASPDFKWPIIDENAAYGACYTTGTTGRPKGAYYSHRAMYLQNLTYATYTQLSVNDCILQIVPMFHAMGWNTPQAGTLVGAKLIFPGKYSLDELGTLAEIIVKEKVTFSNGAPAILMPLLEHIKKIDNKPDMRGARFICGATEPPISMMKDYWDLSRADIVHSYGLTEAMPIVTLNHMRPWLEKELSEEEKWELKKKQGYIVSGIDVKIVDLNGNELPHDGKSTGEILLRGPWVSKSYYNIPNNEFYFTEEGYLKTGDIGTIDSEGFFKLTDRLKDLIKSGGEWISSVDMENEIFSHPAVLDATVIGIPHLKWEERPLALIVLRKEFISLKKEQILDHLSKRFAKWQLPDEILFTDSIPRTSVGKPNKQALRVKYQDLYIKN